MKLIYAAVFPLFPLAAPAQTLDPSMPTEVATRTKRLRMTRRRRSVPGSGIGP